MKNNFKKCTLLAFSLLLFAVVRMSAQNRVALHFDKGFYTTGEVMWYSAHLPELLCVKPIVLRADITDRSGKIVETRLLPTEGKAVVQGYYRIPFDVKSDMYHLVISVRTDPDMQRKILVDGLFAIYNDLEALTIKKEALTAFQTASADVAGLKIEVSELPSTVVNRGKVRAQVRVTDASGTPVAATVSLAAIDAQLSNTTSQPVALVQMGEDLSALQNLNLSNKYIVEGKVTLPDGTPIETNVLGVYSPLNQKFFFTSSDAEGTFYAEMDEFYGTKPVQMVGYFEEHEDIVLKKLSNIEVKSTPELRYSQAVLDYLNSSRQRKKIDQLMGRTAFDMVLPTLDPEVQTIKGDRTILTEKYKTFEDLRTLFNELTIGVSFKKSEIEKGGLDAKIVYPVRSYLNYYPRRSLIIMDGRVTREATLLTKLPQSKAKRIEMFMETKTGRDAFSAFGLNGVIYLETKDGKAQIQDKDAADIFTADGILAPAEFPAFDPKEVPVNQGFYRPQLYWNGTISTDTSGQAIIEYWQSDAVSEFALRVFAADQKGRSAFAEKTYQATPNLN